MVFCAAGALFPAYSMPSFSVQTDETCARCHTSAFGPALTAYGREFKLNGYSQGKYNFVPLSATALGTFAHVKEDPAVSPNPELDANDVAMFNEASVFAASRFTDRSGGYMQATYDRYAEHTRWGNVDIRYTMPWTWSENVLVTGVDLNNNPTVQDLWNTAPAHRYPFVDSAWLPRPAARPLIEGALAQKVLGTTAYAMLNSHYYVEIGAYHRVSDKWLDKLGMDPAVGLRVDDGWQPYWRAVATRAFGRHHFSMGLTGLTVDIRPDLAMPGTDRYTDQGVDATYEFIDRNDDALTVNVSVFREHRNLTASVDAGKAESIYNDLYTRRVDAVYAYDRTVVASAGWFDVRGRADMLQWPAAPYTGSANGDPDTRGYSVQLEYVPFGKTTSPVYRHINFRFGLRYITYKRFNGGTLDYDASGRAVRDNESLLGFAQAAF